ncbi:class I SAM-dependent methyltransferase [Falsibacillus albus]|uniref:SAM-dependent methyltransferase n=1 Tax=Falsibacillus albus TaxID=2478915 RepID=A0A3L7JTF0_9BACI|nr:SAM-dependent methyltransferase [Falsibacillus albus]RLQ93780.1 SAM-dependent methyltransferase [Falsibacillus albus]
MKDKEYDALLNIRTSKEQAGFHSSLHYHRYEPTPYEALERFFRHYPLKSSDRVVDFGCGKGRLNFFAHHLFQSTMIGVEMDELFYEQAVENRGRYFEKKNTNKRNIYFHCCLAETYEIHPEDNHFYFFNPFTVQIFMKVVNNILQSFEENPRRIDLILYYSSEDYIFYLENQTPFELFEEIGLHGYEKNAYEKMLVYRLAYQCT